MVTAATVMTIVFGFFLIAVGCLMLASPPAAIRFLDRFASTTFINLAEASLLVVFGVAVLTCAGSSKFPSVLKVYGLSLIVLGVGIYLVPRRWHREYAVWSVKLVAPHIRLLAPMSVVFGGILIYAVV